jgi:hypothetical protein
MLASAGTAPNSAAFSARVDPRVPDVTASLNVLITLATSASGPPIFIVAFSPQTT